MQIANMADMQQVETAVGQGDSGPGTAPFRNTVVQFLTRENLRLD